MSNTTQTLTLTDFLLVRIAEDEVNATRYLDAFPDGDMAPLFRRVLAECEAKRRIVDNATNMHTSGPDWDEACRFLAVVYADHPDYREEWRP